jgi:nitrogen fixation NifU-like protein
MSIYQEVILDHYRNPLHAGRLEHPSRTIDVKNPLCGDEIHMEARIEGDTFVEISHESRGCAISVAAASMITDYAVGKTKDALKKLDKDFMIDLVGIELSPNRLKCALLPLEALHRLVNDPVSNTAESE